MADDDDFDSYVRIQTPKLIAIAHYLLDRTSDSQDLVQEALIRLYLNWHKMRNHAAVDAYTRKILIRLIRRHNRRRFGNMEELKWDAPDANPAGRSHFGDDDLRRALRALPIRQREVIALRYILDLPISDVAKALTCSDGTVKSHASRGIRSLRLALDSSNENDLPNRKAVPNDK